ncbi:hypothetical protein TNCV_2583951 [Trichonephila clavipes]|nr:hypothetical protein TNCV_2583951 [Trichonephila clavipes]
MKQLMHLVAFKGEMRVEIDHLKVFQICCMRFKVGDLTDLRSVECPLFSEIRLQMSLLWRRVVIHKNEIRGVWTPEKVYIKFQDFIHISYSSQKTFILSSNMVCQKH